MNRTSPPHVPVIGLFGTCGKSTWRTEFIRAYESKSISFFNPQLGPGLWKPECAEIENRHLHEDDIILFPVTSETTGTGSLGEIGFSILESVRSLKTDRYVIVLIDRECLDPQADEKAIKDSNNARHLVRSKVEGALISYHNVFLVETMEEMLTLSIELHSHILNMQRIKSDLVRKMADKT